MSFSIRKIEQADNPEIERIIKTVLEEHGVNKPGTAYFDKSLLTMYESYTDKRSAYFIGLIDGSLSGGSGIFPTEGLPEGTCELVKMYLLPEARGKGLGKALIDHCCAFAKEAGYKKVYLETVPEFEKAIRVYEHSGFKNLDHALGNSGHFYCNIRMIKDI